MSVNSIELRQVRDFGGVLNTTFAFFRENFLNILKTCMPIVLPSILLGCLLAGYATSTFKSFSSFVEDELAYMPTVILGYGLLIFGIFYFYIAVYQYMALYLTVPKAQITFRMVWQHARSTIFPILLLCIILVIMVTVGFFLLVVPAIYMVIPLTFTFVMYVVERRSIRDAINRSFSLMNGEWWSCLGLALIIMIILFLLDQAIMLPYRIMVTGFEMHDLYTGGDEEISFNTLSGAAFGAAYYILSTAASAIQIVCIAVKYFSVVEDKEAVGMMQRVEEMQATQVSAQPL